jgi:hypothetical protein
LDSKCKIYKGSKKTEKEKEERRKKNEMMKRGLGYPLAQ